MKADKLRDLSNEELLDKHIELQDQLFKLKFQHSLGQLENAMRMKDIKKDIARIKTILREKSKGTE